MKPTSDLRLIDAVHGLSELKKEAGWRISRIANALAVLGMKEASESLYSVIDDITEHVENVQYAYGKDLSEKLKVAQQSSTNMLNATLAGLAIGSKNKKMMNELQEGLNGLKEKVGVTSFEE